MWRFPGVEAKASAERGARGRVRSPSSGRPWGLVRSYYEELPSMAGRAEAKGGESLPVISARKYGSRDRNRRRMERREARPPQEGGTLPRSPRLSHSRRVRSQGPALPGAPSPHCRGAEMPMWKEIVERAGIKKE